MRGGEIDSVVQCGDFQLLKSRMLLMFDNYFQNYKKVFYQRLLAVENHLIIMMGGEWGT